MGRSEENDVSNELASESLIQLRVSLPKLMLIAEGRFSSSQSPHVGTVHMKV